MTDSKDALLQDNPGILDVEFTDDGTPGIIKVTLETDGTMTDDEVTQALFDRLPSGMQTALVSGSPGARQGWACVAGAPVRPMYWVDRHDKAAITPPAPYAIDIEMVLMLPLKPASAAPAAKDDPHAGQIYNPYTDTWSWL